MKLEYTYFKDLDKKISDLLKSLELEIDHIYCDVTGDNRFQFDNRSGHETGHHYFLARVTGKAGKQIIKVQLDYPNAPDHIFIKSKSFTKEQRFYKDNIDSFTYVPRYIDSGRFEDVSWLTYEYCEGSTLGLAHTAGAILNENQVDSLIVLLSRIPDAIVTPETALKTRDGAYFIEHLQAFFDAHNKVLSQIITSKEKMILLQLNREFAKIIDGEVPRLVHGDFHPGNIIVSLDHESISIIDWETAHMGTPIMDLALIWIRAWQTNWRDQLIELGKKNLDVKFFDEQLRYVILHLLLDELVFWYWLTMHPEISPLSAIATQALATHMTTFRKLLNSK